MKTRTKLLSAVAMLFVALTLLCAFSIGASAAGTSYPTVPVYFEGRSIIDGEALLINSITYVPLRNMSNATTDCTVSWNPSTRVATVYYNGITVSVRAGDQYISANGRYFYTSGKVLNINGSIYVPIRPLARALGLEVEWNSSSRSVTLKRANSTLTSGSSFYKSDEVYWLSRIIQAEAGGESFDGKIAVGNVVLTRVDDPHYPNTIYGVIFDFKHGIQFTPAYTGTIYNNPSTQSIIAAKVCLEGYEIVPGALFFFNPRIATSNWISQNRPFAKTIGNHDFYY